jgi:hypothetical protein
MNGQIRNVENVLVGKTCREEISWEHRRKLDDG